MDFGKGSFGINDDDKKIAKAVLESRAFEYLFKRQIHLSQCSLIPTSHDNNFDEIFLDLVERPNKANFNWNYAIFWHLSRANSGDLVLGWGDGTCREPNTSELNKFTPLFPSETNYDTQQKMRKKFIRILSTFFGGSDEDRCLGKLDRVTDTELFFLASMYFLFPCGEGGPGRCFRSGKHEWHHLISSNDYCVRTYLAKSTGIQTVVLVPTSLGVVELGSVRSVDENEDFVKAITLLFSPRAKQVPIATSLKPYDKGKNVVPMTSGIDLNADPNKKLSNGIPLNLFPNGNPNPFLNNSRNGFYIDLTGQGSSEPHMVSSSLSNGGSGHSEIVLNNGNMPRKRGRKPIIGQDKVPAHVMADRQRREKINQKFCSLRSVIPNLSRLDKASILNGAVAYIKELHQTIERMEPKKQTAPAPEISIQTRGNDVVDVTVRCSMNNHPLGGIMRVFEEAKITILDSQVAVGSDKVFHTFFVKPRWCEQVLKEKLAAAMLGESGV